MYTLFFGDNIDFISWSGDQDYVGLTSDRIEFLPGSYFVQRRCVTLSITDDELVEGREQFSIQLTKDPQLPAGMVRIVRNNATVTIIDNEISGIELCTILV